MDEQLADELSAIFSQCPKDSKGEVQVKSLIDVLTEKYGDSEIVKDYMINKLDPNGLNEPISEERLQAIMKSVITNWEDDSFGNRPGSPKSTLYVPQYSSTPVVALGTRRGKKLINEMNEDTSSDMNLSVIEESGNSSGVTSAIQKDIIVNLRVKNQELEERLLKTEMIANSFELRLKKEASTVIALKKDNLKVKEELRRLQNLEEIKIEEFNRVDSLEKQFERKSNDYDRASKQIVILDEKLSDLKSENKILTDKLNNASRTMSEQTNTIHILSNELAQLKRDYEQLNKDYKYQTAKLVSLETDHEALVERISQVSNEKQDLQMRLAEMSVCQTITSCMNYSDDVSCEALMSLTELEEDKDDCSSLRKELEQRQVSLDCHSPCDSSINSYSSRIDKFREFADSGAQTDSAEISCSKYVQAYYSLLAADTQTEISTKSTKCVQTYVNLIAVETQTDENMKRCGECPSVSCSGVDAATESQLDDSRNDGSFLQAEAPDLSFITVYTQTEIEFDDNALFELADTSEESFGENETADGTLFLSTLNITRSEEVEDEEDEDEEEEEVEANRCLYNRRAMSVECTTPWATPDGSPTHDVVRRRDANIYRSFDSSDNTPTGSRLSLQFSDCRTSDELCLPSASSSLSSLSSSLMSPSGRQVYTGDSRSCARYLKAVSACVLGAAAVGISLAVLAASLADVDHRRLFYCGGGGGGGVNLLWQMLHAETWIKIRYDGTPPM